MGRVALPDDVSTFTLRTRPHFDALGGLAFIGMNGTLRPSRELRLPDPDGTLVELPVTVTVGEDGAAVIGPIPHTDQFGGFTYSLRWPVPPHAPSPGDVLRFAVPSSAGARRLRHRSRGHPCRADLDLHRRREHLGARRPRVDRQRLTGKGGAPLTPVPGR